MSILQGKKHLSVQSVSGVRDIPRVGVKVKLVTGTYILQVNRATFNQNEISPISLLCQEDDETTEFFILRCSALSAVRQPLLKCVEDMYIHLFHQQPESECLMQFVLDSGAMLTGRNLKQSQLRTDLENVSRCLCLRIHIERFKRLLQVSKKKKRATKVRGSGCSTNT